MRAYSLGMIIVAITVGSQQPVTRSLGFEGNAAGFCTSTLLEEGQDKTCNNMYGNTISQTQDHNTHLSSENSKI